LIVIKNGEIVYERMYSFPHTTNNYCELYAVYHAIKYVLDFNILECQIYSDSTYVVEGINTWMNKWITKDWRGSNNNHVKNMELWKEISAIWISATEVANISIHHVKGHSTNQWNNYVDKLAVKAVKLNHGNNKK
jgi:ribonuclease HI